MDGQGSGAALNRLRTLWRAGTPTFGLIVTMPSVPVIQVLARAGFDWLMLDLEHGPIDLATAHAMIAATGGTPVVPLARIAWHQPWLAKPVLDAGVLGLCLPMVSNRAHAEAAVRAVRYPPGGERAWGPFYAPLRWGVPMQEYLDRADDEVLAIATLEDAEAVRNIDEIVSTPGLDVAFIGIGDLAANLGHRGQADHPDVQAAVARIEAAMLRSNVVPGGVARTPEQANAMLERGYKALMLGFDWSLLQRGAASILDGIRR